MHGKILVLVPMESRDPATEIVALFKQEMATLAKPSDDEKQLAVRKLRNAFIMVAVFGGGLNVLPC